MDLKPFLQSTSQTLPGTSNSKPYSHYSNLLKTNMIYLKKKYLSDVEICEIILISICRMFKIPIIFQMVKKKKANDLMQKYNLTVLMWKLLIIKN